MLSKLRVRGAVKAVATITVVGWIAVGCSATPGAVSEDKELAEFWVSEDYPQLFLRLDTDSGEQIYDLSPCPMNGTWTQTGDEISLQITSILDIIIPECPEKFEKSAPEITAMNLLPDGKAELVNEKTGEKFIFKESTEEEWTKSNKLP